MTKQQAAVTFAALVQRHGIRWMAKGIPPADWNLLAECKKLLDYDDRQQALAGKLRR
jgi:hypothetical protein